MLLSSILKGDKIATPAELFDAEPLNSSFRSMSNIMSGSAHLKMHYGTGFTNKHPSWFPLKRKQIVYQ